jgi:hypothetical protein
MLIGVVGIFSGGIFGYALGKSAASFSLRPRALNFIDWFKEGVDRGYCSPAFCDMHDQAPMTSEESKDFDEGTEPCIPAVRLYERGSDGQAGRG